MESFQRFQQYETDAETETIQQRTCENCGSYVTKQFVRVFGGNNGAVYGCMDCMTGRELREGGGRASPGSQQRQSSVDAD